MKKIFSIGLILTLASVLCTTTSIAKTKNDDIDFFLIPYQKVMDNLTEEFGVRMYVEEKNKEKLYKNVKDMTPKEFEKSLRRDYKEAEKYIHESSNDNAENGGHFGPDYIPNANGSLSTTPLK